jgi:3-hydroxyisobutyrate dehydrogenase-like beta-hydroxyacid dehydrogenase
LESVTRTVSAHCIVIRKHVTTASPIKAPSRLCRRAALLQLAGIAYLAAPVMGRPDVAGAGKLNVLAAGDDTAIESVRLLLDVIGQRTWLIGAEPHQANVASLQLNFLLASAIEAMAEAATLVERYEIDPSKLTLAKGKGTPNASPAARISRISLRASVSLKPGLNSPCEISLP